MKVVLISDTHKLHEKIKLPEGDLLIHAGDISGRGTYGEVMIFLEWFSKLPFKYKVFIAGNHDFFFEKNNHKEISDFPEGVIYLENSIIEIEGISIWGSPYTPEFYNWAFMKKRGEEIKTIWDKIPNKVDILVTHGPPYSILDKNIYGTMCGCEELLMRVKEVQPKIHVFGHIHEGYGMIEEAGTKFYNACVLDEAYQVRNEPYVVDIN
jgi:Icc-related predicted phosphoesterase